MSDLPVTKCPHCGKTSIEFPAFFEAELDDQLTCPSCGRLALKREFVADAVDKVMEIAKDIFGKVPGFRRK